MNRHIPGSLPAMPEPQDDLLRQVRGRGVRCLFVSVPFSGIEVYFRSLQSMLSKRSDIDASWEFIGWEPDKGARHFRLLPNNWTLRASLSCHSRIRKHETAGRKFDVAVFNSIVPTFGLTGFLRKTPSVIIVDVTPALLDKYGAWYGQAEGFAGRLMSRLADALHARRTFRASREILAWSPLVRQSLIDNYGVDAEKITVLAPGVDLSRWSCAPGGETQGPAWKGNRPRVLFVGKEFQRKGGDILIEIASLPEFGECDFHFATAWRRSEEMPENVFLHNDLKQNSDDLVDLYRQSDVFVLPTRADFYPTNACCEAMAMGLPIITTDVGGLGDLIREGTGGFVVPPDDPAALIRGLRTLISDHDLRRRFGAQNRLYAETYFDIEEKGSSLANILFRVAYGAPGVVPGEPVLQSA